MPDDAAEAIRRIAQREKRSVNEVQAAFSFYEAYPGEIEQALWENAGGYERLKERLPSFQLVEVDVTGAS